MYVGIISKIQSHLNHRSLKLIYFSLVHSTLLYGIELWGAANKTTLQPLIVAQKKLIRIISFKPHFTTTPPLFINAQIRPLIEEITFRNAILSVNVINNLNDYDLPITTEHAHQYPTRYVNNNLPVRRVRTVRYGSKGILSSIITNYNDLPDMIKELNPIRKNLIKKWTSHFLWNKYVESQNL